MLNPPVGGPFITRCPRKISKICEDERPLQYHAGDNYVIGCHIFPEEFRAVEPVIKVPERYSVSASQTE